MIEVQCKTCQKQFHKIPSHVTENNYCSKSCAATMNNRLFPKRKKTTTHKLPKPKKEINCTVCGKLTTRRKFCSNTCKSKKYSYPAQRARGLKRKLELIERAGGKCSICGYNKNIAALCFHHLNPSEKEMHLDMRSLSNNSMNVIENEFSKCQLLCMNCHTEVHNPINMEEIFLHPT